PFTATPFAKCGPGSHKEPSVDGRVPAGAAAHGLNCNIALIGHQGTEGGFKVFRYVDPHGHVCAYYDQTLMLPLNALNPGAGSEGVAVLDMSHPAHPVKTDTLTTPPMLSPHESLNINTKRGLLAAVNGNLSTEPGFVAVYSLKPDCRHPVLDALGPYARFGHESGFTSDGNTFYATSTALQAITAIDLSDPKHPHAVWQGNVYSHGMSLSANRNRAYIADPGTAPGGARPGLPTQAGDPGTNNPAQGYAAHYCNVSSQTDPKLVACSFIASGLRVFDISKLKHPKEIAYYVAPPKPRSENGETDSDFAMSKPAFVP